MTDKIRAGNRTIEISNPEKVLFPDDSITKSDLIDYYDRIAVAMVPETKGRLITMERYPDGIDGERFLQKQVSEHFPDWISRKTVPKEGGGKVTHAVGQDRPTLIYLANQACITPHVTLSKQDAPVIPIR